MSAERLLSIHPTLAKAIRSQRASGPDAVVKEGGPGTTLERPWRVVAPVVKKENTSSRNGS